MYLYCDMFAVSLKKLLEKSLSFSGSCGQSHWLITKGHVAVLSRAPGPRASPRPASYRAGKQPAGRPAWPAQNAAGAFPCPSLLPLPWKGTDPGWHREPQGEDIKAPLNLVPEEPEKPATSPLLLSGEQKVNFRCTWAVGSPWSLSAIAFSLPKAFLLIT